jgi:D,D-heptose 1,7-bisphosphate phosphatase
MAASSECLPKALLMSALGAQAMQNGITQAVVLAGGLGTRLGSLTSNTPKPLLPVDGRPFIAYQIDWLARHGIEDIILSTGYLSETFDQFVDAHEWCTPYGGKVAVRALAEPVLAGTAGALKVHEDELQARFLLVNGDSFFDCNLAEVLSKGERLDPGDILLTVREVPDSGRYGRVSIEGDIVAAFEEKSAAGRGLVNAGISVVGRDIVDLIERLPCSIEREIYPALSAAGKLKAVVLEGYFIDIGLPESYAQAQTELPAVTRRPAVFLDRDGVINRDTGYVHRIEDFEWLPGVADAIRAARQAGYLVVVVTNQAGVARGYYDESAVERLHRHINATLRVSGGMIDAFYYCPYHPEGIVPAFSQPHPDRKPNPGMLLKAIADLGIDASRSFMIGDKDIDVEAAQAAGITGIKISEQRLNEVVRQHLGR